MSGSEQATTAAGYAGGEKYYVEKLVDKRIRSGKVEYRVKWWGWESSSNTWESSSTLQEDCPKLLEEFEEALKKRKRAGKQSEQERHRPNPASASSAEEEELQADNAEASGNEDDDDGGEMDSQNEDSGDEVEILAVIPPKRQARPLEVDKAKMKKAKTNGETSTALVPLAMPPTQKKKVIKKRSPKKRKPRKTQVQEDKPKYIPEAILGVTKNSMTNEVQFLIKWKDNPDANLVPASRANIGCPQLVIRFYEDKLIWREDPMELVQSDLDEESEEAATAAEDGYHSDFDWKIVK